MFDDLGKDHVSWLLATANTFLEQRKNDRAIVLLELLGLVDPHNVQGRKMLAYALLLQNDRQRCRATLERLAQCELSVRDRAAVDLLNARLEKQARNRRPRPRSARSTPRIGKGQSR